MTAQLAEDSLPGVIAFLLEIDRLKTVERRAYVAGGARRENSAEHSWHVAVAVWMLSRQAGVTLDLLHVLKLALAHDLGEIDAGDVPIYDQMRRDHAPAEKACLERLRGMAPDTLSELPDLWAEYEEQLTPESHWLRVADRLLPFLHNLASAGKTWREQGVRRDQVLAVNEPIARTYPALYRWIELQSQRALAEGWLKDESGRSLQLPSAAQPTAALQFGELTLRGRELVLRPLAREDAEALAQAAAEDRSEYRYTPVPDGMAEAEAYVERALRMRAADERYAFAVVWRGRVVGSTSYYDYQRFDWPAGSELAGVHGPDVLEIGHTWLAASAQRTRCNTEAKYLLLEHAFERWSVQRVRFRTDERNQRSRQAIERIGARFEGIVRGDKPASDGTLRNSAYFSIVRAEWPAIAARLRGLIET